MAETQCLSSNGTDKSDVPMCFQPPYCQWRIQVVDSPASHWIVQFEVSKAWACEWANRKLQKLSFSSISVAVNSFRIAFKKLGLG